MNKPISPHPCNRAISRIANNLVTAGTVIVVLTGSIIAIYKYIAIHDLLMEQNLYLENFVAPMLLIIALMSPIQVMAQPALHALRARDSTDHSPMTTKEIALYSYLIIVLLAALCLALYLTTFVQATPVTDQLLRVIVTFFTVTLCTIVISSARDY